MVRHSIITIRKAHTVLGLKNGETESLPMTFLNDTQMRERKRLLRLTATGEHRAVVETD